MTREEQMEARIKEIDNSAAKQQTIAYGRNVVSKRCK